MRFFNTAGPVDPAKHYALDPLQRLDLEEVLGLIAQEKWFVLHAPRQTGKTSSLLALRDYLNHRGEQRCIYVNVEAAQSAREDVKRAMRAVLHELATEARDTLADETPNEIWPDLYTRAGEDMALNAVLTTWAKRSRLPLVLLFDEVDALIGDTLISLLRQLRAGYSKRPTLFPPTIVLCGVRDVRDYRIQYNGSKGVITGGSAFNVKAESLRLGDFSAEEVNALLSQHTQETGQVFTPEALRQVWYWSEGQPWLVNALAYEACFRDPEGRNRRVTIDGDCIVQSKERLILRRETHLDQLMDKLEEERVRRVIEPIIAGDALAGSLRKDDVAYVQDLGLIHQDPNGAIRLANPIYREVIPRELSWDIQSGMSEQSAWYIRPDGGLDMNKLLEAFQQFFREHSEHWIERFQYKEAGPQLLMQAFLQRIVNGGGRIEREYGLGRLRTDLLIIWPCAGHTQRVVIELKIIHKGLQSTLAKGLEQTWAYMDRCGADSGHLVLFDRALAKPWEKKLFHRTERFRERTIEVWGM